MSVPREPDPAQAMVSLLCAGWESVWPGVRVDLEAFLGPMDFEAGPVPFTHTGYYDAELGRGITRRILGFGPLLAQDRLREAKLFTNELEKRYARPDGRRRVNLDPGLVTQERLVLATGKNFSHRVYLGSGIFADLTLVFRGGTWQALEWTFPDYAGGELHPYLNELRARHKAKLKAGRATGSDPLCPKA